MIVEQMLKNAPKPLLHIADVSGSALFQGDCLDIMPLIPDNSIDMVLTSPPYDNLRDYKGYTFNFEGIAQEIYRVLKDGGVCVWVVGDATINGSETGTSFKQALYFKEIGFNLHDTMIYEKLCYMPLTHKRQEQAFEYMFILSKKTPKTFNPRLKKNKEAGKTITGNRRHNGNDLEKIHGTGNKIKEYGQDINIWRYATGKTCYDGDIEARKHPAVFPSKLAEDHILTWSNEGDTILDPMAGSGTTLKMAKKNNRNYIGIEISQEYIDIINKRLTQDTNPKE